MINGKAIFAITAASVLLAGAISAGAQESILFSFSSLACAAQPDSAPVFDTKGNLYGTCLNTSGDGFVYELSPKAGGGWTERTIFTFGADGTTDKGSGPNGLIFDAQKVNLFGTASAGGAQGNGVVYELSPAASGGWTQTVLYSFGTNGANDGVTPTGSLVFNAAGDLFGTTSGGGANFNSGAAFELIPKAGGAWTETVIHSFSFLDSVGSSPQNGLIFDARGNLYGTTNGGAGTVFELSPAAGGTWTAQPIGSFAAFSNPAGNLIFDASGNLYGVSTGGGANGNGAVYEWSPASGGTWKAQTIYSFGQTAKDGTGPLAGVILGPNGAIYGTTASGGEFSGTGAPAGYGTIFELVPGTGSWMEKVLYNFDDPGDNDGFHPDTDLTLDTAGNIYGSSSGGTDDVGAVFELTSPTTVDMPQFLPAPGTYIQAQSVEITDPTPDTTIYYTTNGTAPTTASTKYSGAITVAATETIEAIGVAAGLTDSPMATAKYTITPPTATPVFSPLAGTYASAQKVTITDATSGAVIYYTINGTTPTTSSTRYSGAIAVSASETIHAIAIASNHITSAVATAAYKIETPAAAPTFSPPAGAYTGTQLVTIADAVAGATIYYTTNGTAPTSSSTKYSSAIALKATDTIEAIATAPSYLNSSVATAKYTILPIAATPVISPASGTYAVAQPVSLTDATPGSVLYYTTDGTAPTTSSLKYTGPIVAPYTETIQAVAIAPGYAASAAATANYAITTAEGWKENLLYSFGASTGDGHSPVASLLFDARGNLYGTTNIGGTNGCGTVFELSPATAGGWTEKILYNFEASPTVSRCPAAALTGPAANLADPPPAWNGPAAPLIFDASGNLYGTTVTGGAHGKGTVFELSPGTGGVWTEKVLHSFGATATDGENPWGAVVFDAKGNLYGTTRTGGLYVGTPPGGTFYELTPGANGTWTESFLFSFGATAADGMYPTGGLIFDTKGNLYGTANTAGLYGNCCGAGGAVFEFSPTKAGGWTEKVLHSFGQSGDGNGPQPGLAIDSKGNLYGTTNSGGLGGLSIISGTVFELSPTATGWTEKLLYSFDSNVDGYLPNGNLRLDAKGNLYGTTEFGGAIASGSPDANGTVFKLSPSAAGTWTETANYSFGGSGKDGINPITEAGLVMDAKGNLYGTTSAGGASNSGTVFEIQSITAATPVFSPAAGTYVSGQQITIADSTPGAAIYFTTNGTTPTTASTRYTAPIKLSVAETIKAIAIDPVYTSSPVASAAYKIGPAAAAPVIAPSAGKYPAAQTVTIPDATAGATIHYTTNGAASTKASTR